MPRFPFLDRRLGPQDNDRDPSAPLYWIDGAPVYRIDRTQVYYRAAGTYPLPQAPTYEPPPASYEPEPQRAPSCVWCGGVNTTQSMSGTICMGCFQRAREAREEQRPRLPPPPDTPKIGKREAARVLGLTWPVTKAQVVEAYRKLVVELHADRGGSDERLREILQARDRLIPPPVQVKR